MYLVNERSKLESVNRVHEIGEKSHSLLDHPRIVRCDGLKISRIIVFIVSVPLVRVYTM